MQTLITTLIFSFLLSANAMASAASDTMASAKKIKANDSYFDAHVETYRSVFKDLEKKRRQGFTPQPVYECDLLEKCREGYQVFFRGEDHKFDLPGASALVRTVIRGDYGSPIDDATTMKHLSADLLRLGKNSYAPQSEDLILMQKQNSRGWFYLSDRKTPFKTFFHAPETAMTSIQTLIGFHVEASGLFLETPSHHKASLDPIISFSSSPMQAMSFAKKDDQNAYGRFIMISVPVQSIQKHCLLPRLPAVGKVIDANECVSTNEYSEELEYDVFMAINPNDLLEFKPE